MIEYVLVICAGISWAGCGVSMTYAYPDEEACQRALQTMIIQQNGQAVAGKNGRQMYAFCRPKQN
jgi:hypothetical protein